MSYKMCICFDCNELIDENSSPDCACEDTPLYERDKCMECPKRKFCDVTAQPMVYMGEICDSCKFENDPSEHCDSCSYNYTNNYSKK